MNYTSRGISHQSTKAFSDLVIDYIGQDEFIRNFFTNTPDWGGLQSAIAGRKNKDVDRELLVTALTEQYKGVNTSEEVFQNIQKLRSKNTFTICTAHQPNIFTGYLYFIYKILHAVKIADELKIKYPDNNYVPVYYMGSEDNDLEELDHINLNGDRLTWQTSQTGAVGRMNTKGIEKIIDQISGQLSIFKFGPELISILKESYLQSTSVQDATFKFVNTLFSKYGLIILIADSPLLKKQMIPVFKDDLFNNTPKKIVDQTIQKLSVKYHIQVNPRDINLFYMIDNIRERIFKEDNLFKVNNTEIVFTKEEIEKELDSDPERFSPNVVLRGLYQEMILPDIAFIGGGSEIAYWLELKDLFAYYDTAFPVLILRNSFLIIEESMVKLINKLDIPIEALFNNENTILSDIVKGRSSNNLSLTAEVKRLSDIYEQIKHSSGVIDPTLMQHADALKSKAEKGLQNLEKKILKAEKRKYEDQKNQVTKLKFHLFPNNNLQERVENILPYYAKSGADFIQVLYDHSPTLQPQFTILTEGKH